MVLKTTLRSLSTVDSEDQERSMLQKILPKNSGKSLSEYRLSILMTLMILMKQPCVSAIDILIMGSISVIIIIFLHHYSMWSFLRHHRCSVPSCPPDVVDLPFSACQRRRLLIICLGKKPRTLRDFYWSVT